MAPTFRIERRKYPFVTHTNVWENGRLAKQKVLFFAEGKGQFDSCTKVVKLVLYAINEVDFEKMHQTYG